MGGEKIGYVEFGNPSSNPGQGCLHFSLHNTLEKGMKQSFLKPAMGEQLYKSELLRLSKGNKPKRSKTEIKPSTPIVFRHNWKDKK